MYHRDDWNKTESMSCFDNVWREIYINLNFENTSENRYTLKASMRFQVNSRNNEKVIIKEWIVTSWFVLNDDDFKLLEKIFRKNFWSKIFKWTKELSNNFDKRFEELSEYIKWCLEESRLQGSFGEIEDLFESDWLILIDDEKFENKLLNSWDFYCLFLYSVLDVIWWMNNSKLETQEFILKYINWEIQEDEINTYSRPYYKELSEKTSDFNDCLDFWDFLNWKFSNETWIEFKIAERKENKEDEPYYKFHIILELINKETKETVWFMKMENANDSEWSSIRWNNSSFIYDLKLNECFKTESKKNSYKRIVKVN